MEDSKTGIPSGEDLIEPPGDGVLALINAEGTDSPNLGRALRKSSIRVRQSKAKPQSPLLRMAEMRRAGLRGRNLIQPEKKRLGSSGGKGVKGVAGRSLQILNPSFISIIDEGKRLEVSIEGSGSLEVGEGSAPAGELERTTVSDIVMSGAEGESRDVALVALGSVKGKGGSYKQALQKAILPLGDSNDLALDLIAAQPLQEMEFVAEQVLAAVEYAVGLGREDDLPPLSKERLKLAKEK